MVKLLEGILTALEKFKERVLEGVIEFFKALIERIVEFLEALYEWLVEAVKAIWDYLVRLFTALGKLLWVLLQLLLVYIPSFLMVGYYFAFNGHWGWIAGGVLWAVIVTLAGLFYPNE